MSEDNEYNDNTIQATQLSVECDSTVTAGSTITVTGSLIVKEEGTPVEGALIYLEESGNVKVALTDETGGFTQTINVTETPGYTDLRVYFLGDSFYGAVESSIMLTVVYNASSSDTMEVVTYESDTSDDDSDTNTNSITIQVLEASEEDDESTATVTDIDTGEEYTTTVTLLSTNSISTTSEDETDESEETEYSFTGTLVDGVASFTIPNQVEGIWEVTADYPEQDVYKASNLVEEVQFSRTPYFVTTDGATEYTGYRGYPLTVSAVLYDSDGSILANRSVATSYRLDDTLYDESLRESYDSLGNSDATSTDSDGLVSRTITYDDDNNLVLRFKYGGSSTLNPAKLDVKLDITKFKTVLTANSITIKKGSTGNITVNLKAYASEDYEELGYSTYLSGQTIVFEAGSIVLTGVTDSTGSYTFEYTPTQTEDHIYKVTYGGSSVYANSSVTRDVVINSADGTIATVLSTTPVTSTTVEQNNPVTIGVTLSTTSGTPVIGATVGARIGITRSTGEITTSSIDTIITDSNGYGEVTYQYDGIGTCYFIFNFAGNSNYAAADTVQTTAIWTKITPEIVASDIDCEVEVEFEIQAILRYYRYYDDGSSGYSNINDATLTFLNSNGTVIGTAVTSKGVASITNTMHSEGEGKLTIRYDGSDTFNAVEKTITIDSTSDKTYKETTLTTLYQDTGTSNLIDTTQSDDYYYAVNERCKLRVQLTDEDGDTVSNQTINVTHDNALDSSTLDPITTSVDGVATLYYNGKTSYWTDTTTHTTTFTFSYDGEGSYNSSSDVSIIVHWERVTPILEVPNLETTSGYYSTLEATLYYLNPSNTKIYIENMAINWVLNSSQTLTATTDSNGYASKTYKRTSTGTVNCTAESEQTTLYNSVTVLFTITTVEDSRTSTSFVLDSDTVYNVEDRRLAEWTARLKASGAGGVAGRRVTVKVNGSSWLQDIYTDTDGYVDFKYATAQKLSTSSTLSSATPIVFSYGGDNLQYKSASLSENINWQMVTPVIVCGDISHVQGRVYMYAYIYYTRYDGVLVPLNNATVTLHISSSLEKSLTSDSNGLLKDTDGYNRTSTGSVTSTRWVYGGQDDLFNSVTQSFKLTTYSSTSKTSTTLTPNYTRSDSLFLIRGEQTGAVSATLTDSDGNALANKLVKSVVSSNVKSSTAVTDSIFDTSTTQYLMTDSNGVVTRYFHPSDPAFITTGMYYYIRFSFNDDGYMVDYESCSCDCKVNDSWIIPTLNCSNVTVVAGESTDLKAKFYYTTCRGEYVAIEGANIDFCNGDGTVLYTAVTDSNGLATYTGYHKDTVGQASLTVKYTKGNESDYPNDHYVSVSTTLSVKAIDQD